MLKYETVLVKRSETTEVQETIGQWEVPLMKAVHGEDAVTHVRDVLIDREPPAAGAEMQRLLNRYRRSRNDDGSQGIPYAHMVYGQMGLSRLQQAIQAAVQAAPEGSLVDEPELNSSVGG